MVTFNQDPLSEIYYANPLITPLLSGEERFSRGKIKLPGKSTEQDQGHNLDNI